jgi:hypothetical protein
MPNRSAPRCAAAIAIKRAGLNVRDSRKCKNVQSQIAHWCDQMLRQLAQFDMAALRHWRESRSFPRALLVLIGAGFVMCVSAQRSQTADAAPLINGYATGSAKPAVQ